MKKLNVGQKLKEAMLNSRMTQVELAKALGIKQSSVSRLIKNINTPKIKTLTKAAKVLGVPLNFFLNDIIGDVRNNKGIVGHNSNIVGQDNINEVSRIALLEKDVENLKLKLELLLERQQKEKN
ncbi:MAG: helix-turn-helix domain-containing protein [Campylobacteraceae bacterium]|jgi:transcriptional regulator with XRE-family HTH domain|nr:helix-turn-helix domain-containing protein [Campylobacteraceae bacterium]